MPAAQTQFLTPDLSGPQVVKQGWSTPSGQGPLVLTAPRAGPTGPVYETPAPAPPVPAALPPIPAGDPPAPPPAPPVPPVPVTPPGSADEQPPASARTWARRAAPQNPVDVVPWPALL